MARTATRVSILGIFLVALGSLLLLKKFGVINVHAREILWPSLSLLGLFLAGRGLAEGRKGKIFGGTLLFLYGIFFLIRSFGSYDLPVQTIFPATFIIFGIVFVMLFVNRTAEWYYLVPGLLLLAVGVSMMLTEYGYWYGWEIRDVVKTWWPFALVLMGVGMLLSRRNGAGHKRDTNPRVDADPSTQAGPPDPAPTAQG